MELTKETIENLGFEFRGGVIPTLIHNNIEISLYGETICCITVDGKDIEEIFQIPEETEEYYDELQYRITEEAKNFVIDRLMEGR